MRGIRRSLLVSLWFMFLTFPILVIKVSPLDGSIIWRWHNALYLGASVFILAFVWRAMLVAKGVTSADEADLVWFFELLRRPKVRGLCTGLLFFLPALLPLWGLYLTAANGSLEVFTRLGSISSGTPEGQKVFRDILLTSAEICVKAGLALGLLRAARFCFAGRQEELFGRMRGFREKLSSPGATRTSGMLAGLVFLCTLPFLVDMYQVNVLSSALIWIMLGLGLNIVVGQAGLLVLGYVAFYAVGAYSYAMLNQFFGNEFFGFWLLLPLGGLLAAVAGIALSLPVLRLRGDYLAIVTLGFGEIVRVTLEAGSLSLAPVASFISLFTDAPLPAWLATPLDLGGPAGISNIPYPGLFGIKMSMDNSIRYIYFIALAMTGLTIIASSRLRDSRLGRSWMALREDEIACEAMGINRVSAKLSAFALGACWAGFGGVLFAAKTSFINPTSFTFMESALILSVVVLGGLGSIWGVTLGACVLILLPEYLRDFNEYRMLIFGACMVLMMVFRPQGLITVRPKKRIIAGAEGVTP